MYYFTDDRTLFAACMRCTKIGRRGSPFLKKENSMLRSLQCVVTALTLLLIAIELHAQWLNYPTPGIPRTPDGKPDLSAPAPRTADGKPDVSGLWRPNAGGYLLNITADLQPNELQPWAAALTKRRIDDFGRDNPTTWCLPPGPTVRAMAAMAKIINTGR